MPFSTQYGQWIGDWFARTASVPAPPANIYLALNMGDPLADNSGATELVGHGYLRQPIVFSSVQNGLSTWQISNSASVVFPQATSTAPSPITHWSLFDAASDGTILLHGAWDSSRQWLDGTSFTIAIGAFLADVYTTDL